MKPNAEIKAALRAQLRAELNAHPAALAAIASADICARVQNSSPWKSARTVLLFHPLPSEPNVTPLLAAALATGKLLALPRFNAATKVYEPVQILDLDRELIVGPFGVREPVAQCPRVEMKRLDLGFVPGLSFDARGHRLGRGKGYYDRLLTGFTGMKIGVAFDFQLVTEAPHEAHDISLDAVVTPTRWIEAKTG